MTLRLLKKRQTTAPKVQAETLRKSTRSSLGQTIARTASFAILTGASLLASTVVGQQDQEPERYSPPVHIQPAAWSVLEDEFPRSTPVQRPDQRAIQRLDQRPVDPPKSFSRGQEIASMSQYMRMQNEAVLASKNAQVNAAEYHKQYALANANMAQSPPPAAYVPRQQYRYPEPQPATIQVTARPQNVQPRTNVQARPPQPRPAASRQLTTSRARAPQRVVSQPKPQQQTQARRGVGLQDRITLAIRKRVEQSKQRSNAAMNRAQTIPVSGEPSQARQVQYQQTAPTLAEALPVLGPPKVAVTTNQRNPGKARNLGYRPEPGTENDQVIVPSFVDSDFEVSAPLELASIEHPVAPERRGPPRVTSRAQPMGYVSAHKGDQPVFRNAKAQLGSSQEEDSERLRRLENELDARSSQSRDSELPQRPGQESSPLLDVDDDDADTAEEEARRARSKLDAELDAFDDDDSDIDLEDEGDDESPPVYDERGCAELRDMLLNQPIREISLDISPPASPRRFEIGNITRSWTDHAGNVIATGTMVDLRRGYVILDSGQKLPYAKLGEADWTAIAENWLLPSVCSIGQRGNLGRNWAPQTVTWHASSLCHKPLYFENVQLERYGHSHGPIMQPVRSAIHFFGSIIFLPYNTAINPPNECRSALGYYRPGSCAPWLLDPIPFSREGIRRQALATVGAAFIP